MTSQILMKRASGVLLITILSAALIGVLFFNESWALLALFPIAVSVLVRVPRRSGPIPRTMRSRALGIALIIGLLLFTFFFIAYCTRKLNGDLVLGDQGLLAPRDHYYTDYQGNLEEISRLRFIAVGVATYGLGYLIFLLRILLQFPLSSPRTEGEKHRPVALSGVDESEESA